MNPMYLSVCFSLILLSETMGLATKRTSYISWDDFSVEEGLKLHAEGKKKSSVIVVDRNGKGDSLTVQGAVDMVPNHNNQRVKIHILPGLYRFSIFFLFIFVGFPKYMHVLGSCFCSGSSTSSLDGFSAKFSMNNVCNCTD